jgi:tRNA A37 threonylcarbamoyladenosine dehydratase
LAERKKWKKSRKEQKKLETTFHQQKLARLKYGIVGVGSVGSIVAESLARMGVEHIKLIDYDYVELHNLDRLIHASVKDAQAKRRKVDMIARALKISATAAKPVFEKLPLALTEGDGFR